MKIPKLYHNSSYGYHRETPFKLWLSHFQSLVHLHLTLLFNAKKKIWG